jgi:hypothetical protein
MVTRTLRIGVNKMDVELRMKTTRQRKRRTLFSCRALWSNRRVEPNRLWRAGRVCGYLLVQGFAPVRLRFGWAKG